MDWLQSADVALFRFINLRLSNAVFDSVMPILAGHPLFIPAMIVLGIGLVWKGGVRGRVFVTMLLLTLAVGDTFVINTIKHISNRPRPFLEMADIHLLVGRGHSSSMPSSHASTWFAAAFVAFVYYRNSWKFLLPAACLMAFSRVYVGVHYPSDVLAGVILGAGYAAAVPWGAEWLWRTGGRRWCPDCLRRIPSLLDPPARSEAGPSRPLEERTWLHLGYGLIALVFLARLAYLSGDKIELSEDEAYQWLWSKHLAASYYSKPPGIAYAQFLGTSIWGDTAFGVRFLAPVISVLTSLLMLRFLARYARPRVGFFLILISNCTPLLAAGSVLMTVDPLLVLFWTAAMIAGWQAMQEEGRTADWLWAGLWTGLGFLSKYSALFVLVCWSLYFVSWPAARRHLRRPGPYLALLVITVCSAPVVWWNAQHEWITVGHVASNAKLEKVWQPTLRYFAEFLGTELGLLNPIFFMGALAAMVGVWRRSQRRALEVYLFCLGAPVFLGYWAYTLHSRVLPNWIAPAVLAMFALMVVYWMDGWKYRGKLVRTGFWAGVLIGLIAVILFHDTNLVQKITGHRLPLQYDPLRRVRGWEETAKLVEQKRQAWARESGREIFIIGGHYGITGQLSFHIPAAHAHLPEQPLVYYLSSDRPKNQFYFWPHYQYQRTRRGQDAIFVEDNDSPEPAPKSLTAEFERVEDLGIFEIKYRKQTYRRVQIFICRNLL